MSLVIVLLYEFFFFNGVNNSHIYNKTLSYQLKQSQSVNFKVQMADMISLQKIIKFRKEKVLTAP